MSTAFRLTGGFQPGYFRRLIEAVNPQLSRFKESSLSPLLDVTARLRNGHTFSAVEKEQIQELVFHIPYDKQQKYKKALEHLRDTARICICGRPVEPGMRFHKFQVGQFRYNSGGRLVDMPVGSYHHIFEFSWRSSTGNMESLRGVGTREHVKFRSSPSAPPFNYVQASVPLEFFQGSPDGGQFGTNHDDHSTKHPGLICADPRVVGELVAEQWYQYTIDKGKTWENIPGAAYLITKGARERRGEKVFFFSKTNWPPHNTKTFRFEVEYEIGAPPSPMPEVGIKLGMQSGNDADLRQHASRIVSLG